MKRWKRSDVSTLLLCRAIRGYGVHALDILAATQGIPPKVLLAAVYRDSDAGYVTWGVSAWRPFLDRRGTQLLEEPESRCQL